MLSRRNIRTKVMQTLYGYEQDAFSSKLVAERNLKAAIDSAFDLFLYNLHILERVSTYTLKVAEIKRAKYLPTDDDLQFSTKLAGNEIASALRESKFFQNILEQGKLHLFDNEDVIRQLFKEFAQTEEYQNYNQHPEQNIGQDRNILKKLYNKVVVEEEMFLNHIDELFANALDDLQVVKFKVNDFLNDFSNEDNIIQLRDVANTQEDKKFAVELFSLTIDRNDEFLALIDPKLKNWEADRLAKVDIILLKMAICELLFFKYIPVKVTINEYIDIAKVYSTPKSKDFINGVLDKLMRELQDTGKIKKSGRGLLG